MNEIEYIHFATGITTLKCVLGDANGQRWNTDSGEWEALILVNLQYYDIAMSETPAGSYRYAADLPTGLDVTGGLFAWVFDVSGTLSASDLPNYLGSGIIVSSNIIGGVSIREQDVVIR